MGRKGGGEMDGEPSCMIQKAALRGADERWRRQGHLCRLRSWSAAGCAAPVRRIVGPLSKGRHPTVRHMTHEGRMAPRAGAYLWRRGPLFGFCGGGSEALSPPLADASPAEVVSLGGCSDQSAYAGEGWPPIYQAVGVAPFAADRAYSKTWSDRNWVLAGK